MADDFNRDDFDAEYTPPERPAPQQRPEQSESRQTPDRRACPLDDDGALEDAFGSDAAPTEPPSPAFAPTERLSEQPGQAAPFAPDEDSAPAAEARPGAPDSPGRPATPDGQGAPPTWDPWARPDDASRPPEPLHDRPRYDQPAPPTDPWQPRPSTRRGGRGWAVGLICLLALAFFLTGAVAMSAQQRGLWDTLGAEVPRLPDPWTEPPDEPTAPTFPSGQEPGPGIGGNAPMDETGDASLDIADHPASAPFGQALSIREIAEKIMPSVVGILGGVEDDYSMSSGSGIIMTADGYVITNNHVVEREPGLIFDDITVVLHNGDKYKVVQARVDRNSDLAVLKIEAVGLTPAEFGDSDRLAVGDLAVAIGNPLGMELQSTVTNGIISAINRDIVIEDVRMTAIQTNCAINPGNSGGPLINEYGQVVGIISSKIMSDYFSVVEGLGFAIPSNTARPIVNELITRGYVKGRPAIGISGRTVDERAARAMDVPEGLQVVEINPDCDAYKQGLRVDDIITHVMDQPVTTVNEVNLIKNEYQVGDELTVTVFRPSEQRAFDVDFKLMDSGELSG